jgi:amino acid transporter
MDFDRFKAAWQSRKVEGSLLERPSSRIVADLRNRTEAMERKNRARDVMQIGAGVACLALIGLLFRSGQPAQERMGVVLVMAGVVLNVISFLVLRLGDRGRRYELPVRTFLIEERRRIEARIRVIRLSTTWYAVPMLAGAVLYSASAGAPPPQMAIITGAMVAVVSYIGWVNRRRIYTQLAPSRDEIDRELAELEAGSD